MWDKKTKACPSFFFFTFFIAKKVTKNLVLSKAFSGRKPKFFNSLIARKPILDNHRDGSSICYLSLLLRIISPYLLQYHCQPMLLPYAGASDIGKWCLRRVFYLVKFSTKTICLFFTKMMTVIFKKDWGHLLLLFASSKSLETAPTFVSHNWKNNINR